MWFSNKRKYLRLLMASVTAPLVTLIWAIVHDDEELGRLIEENPEGWLMFGPDSMNAETPLGGRDVCHMELEECPDTWWLN